MAPWARMATERHDNIFGLEDVDLDRLGWNRHKSRCRFCWESDPYVASASDGGAVVHDQIHNDIQGYVQIQARW